MWFKHFGTGPAGAGELITLVCLAEQALANLFWQK